MYEFISNLLDKKEEFVIATILKKIGSAPRKEGTKMLIRKDYSIVGTIGGGIMEAMVIESAIKVFENKSLLIKEYVLNNKDAASQGMICGGDIEVLLEYVDCDNVETSRLYGKIVELQKNKTDFIIITQIADKIKNMNRINKWILLGNELYGIEDGKPREIIDTIKNIPDDMTIHSLTLENTRYVVERFSCYEKVFIIGAGHVAQKISDIAKILGFYVIVIDDRAEFANRERFKMADKIKVVESFDVLSKSTKFDYGDYVIIVTRGHIHDKDVLGQVLMTSAKYIGMIGSRKKRDSIYEKLSEQGFVKQDFDRVSCPIGLPIHADTPEEIAISIAAEIIKVKNGDKDGKQ